MNDNHNAFQIMLDEAFNMQVPIITMTSCREFINDFEGYTITNHIIVPGGLNMCVDMTFEVYGKEHTGLVSMKPVNMSFPNAVPYYANKVLDDQGSHFELYSL